MKSKIITFLCAIAFVSVNAQTTLYEEDFESSGLIPEEITLINADGFAPNDPVGDAAFADSAWIVGTTGRPEFDGTQIAIGLSYYENNDSPADDWLILPAISLGGESVLTWEAMSLTSSGNYPDDYMVLIAAAEAGGIPTVEYFENNGAILLQVAPENWSAAVSNVGDGIASRTIDLQTEGYTNQDVWIAFRLITGNGGGSYLALDNIKVVDNGVSITDSKFDNLDATVYPNPSNGWINVGFKAETNGQAEVFVQDIIGRVVYSKTNRINAGENNLKLNLEDLPKGVYMVNTILNNKRNATKLMVQ